MDERVRDRTNPESKLAVNLALRFKPSLPGLVDVRRVYDAKGDLRVSSAYVSQLPLYAGTYDVLDEIFHRKSLLCECREEDPD